MASEKHEFEHVRREFTLGDETYQYFSLPDLNDERYNSLPYCIRVLLESAVRNCDGTTVTKQDVENILDWQNTSKTPTEIAFKPARVILQDFTGVPGVVDFAAMRDAVHRLGGDASKVNPRVPVDLVIDHSVQVDKFGTEDAMEVNLQKEMERNSERFAFLKWGAKAFSNFSIVPPGAGIVHQVNLEFLARVVFNNNGVLYPDSLVGTDSHTPMVNGLGVLGWGVGGIEAEAVALEQPISMVLPEVVGYKLTGSLPAGCTSTDLVLTVTRNLRQEGVVGKFVEFFGEGAFNLTIADRATIANMSPEMGATVSFFAVDSKSLDYMRVTGRTDEKLAFTETYLKKQDMFVQPGVTTKATPKYTKVLELDLSTIIPAVAGPKRPHDFVAVSELKKDFTSSLTNPVGFKGFGLEESHVSTTVPFEYEGKSYELKHGSVVIAAITSCTNTSNPSVMIGAGLLAQKAVAKGLTVEPFVKTSLAPGSGVVTQYLEKSNLLDDLAKLGFSLVGYGCTTCIGNSGPLPAPVEEAITKGDLVCAGVLSGNRNFEGRIHPYTRANYLASPPLVVAYALAGRVDIDFETEPLGTGSDGNPVFLRDIWPSQDEVATTVNDNVLKEMFTDTYSRVTQGTDGWNALDAPDVDMYPWDEKSTYIHQPPFFSTMEKEPKPLLEVKDARCLLNLGDSITTDHISPAGMISRSSPAARYLESRGVAPKDFNSYGSRRGNDQVMVRGTFANIRLLNKFIGKAGPVTVHHPSGEVMSVFDASAKYIEEGTPLVILAGDQYGSGSSRDWAAKGVWMMNVKVVIATSYERIHRSNLVLFGVIPLEFLEGESADSLGLTGKESFSVKLGDSMEDVKPGQIVEVTARDLEESDKVTTFKAKLRFDTDTEIKYFQHGGVLNYVIRQCL